MFYKLEKLQNRLHELDRLRYRELKQVEAFQVHEPEKGRELHLPEGYSNGQLTINDAWSGRDRYLWLHTTLTIPSEWRGKKKVLYLDLGRTGGGNNSGFESLLYVNKKPCQGVDSNHKEIILPDTEEAELEIDVLLWSGLEGGGHPQVQYYRLKEAWYGWLDDQADRLYYKSKALLDSIKRQKGQDTTRIQLLSSLDRAFHQLDWSNAGSEDFYTSVYQALDDLTERMNSVPKHADVTIHTVGHSHIDLAWLWRTKHTKEKAKRTFTTVLRLMELYPDYNYVQSQPQLYEWIKEEDPALFQAIQQKVEQGQWEVEGAMWVEADCNIPSGESFVRQLLYGKRFFEQEFKKKNRTLWLPDVFGYSWSLPQILRKSGIDTFMTTKISWNQYNRMPHDTFRWRGIDGSEILTHFITTPEPGRAEDSWFYTYNGLITAETVQGIWEKYRDKEVNQELLLAYGYGDGGGGVNREMLEMKREFHLIPGMPNVESTPVSDYFAKLHEKVQNSEHYIHTWDGELYLEYHRGTYTSQAKMKERNRRLEWAYREAEFVSVWNGIIQGWTEYPSASLEQGWKLLLLNQFHDIIPGSSITEVYEDAHQDYDHAAVIQQKVLSTQEKSMLEESEHSWSFVHPHQYRTSVLLKVPSFDQKKSVVYQVKGESVLSQKTARGEDLVLIEESIPFSYQSLTCIPVQAVTDHAESKKLSAINLEQRTWETPYYALEWNAQGQLTRIYDKQAQREMIKQGEQGNLFKLYEDKPLAHDAWDIDLFYQEKFTMIDQLKECKIVDNGPIRTTLCFIWEFPQGEMIQYVHSYRHTKRLDFETEVLWNARQKLLKVEFPVEIRSTEAIYDIQFGNVKRPTHWNTSWDMARFETVGHKWAALAEPYYGIGLLNNSKYGYSIKNHVLALSLLKGSVYPDPHADLGKHHFTYSLYPFGGIACKHEVEREATYLNSELRVLPGKVKQEFEQCLFSVTSEQVILDTIKKAEDRESIILRLHEMEGSTTRVHIESSYKIRRWREVNMMEDESYTDYQPAPLTLSFTPYEIKTIEVELE